MNPQQIQTTTYRAKFYYQDGNPILEISDGIYTITRTYDALKAWEEITANPKDETLEWWLIPF